MKIAYISKSFIPSRTANSIHVMKMCSALAENGHEVTLLAPNFKNLNQKEINDVYSYYGVKNNFEIKKLWYPKLKGEVFFYTLSIFIFLLFNRKYILIYGRFILGCYVASLLRHNVVLESHAPIYEKKDINQKIFKKLIKSKYFTKLVVISKVLKDMYLENGYLDKKKIEVNHDAADEVQDFNTKINLFGERNNLKVGYVGHLYKGKGMEVIDSIAKKLDKDVEIHIIGGLEKDIKLWREKIINKNIYFYGFIPHSKISNYINSLDICLLPNQKIVLTHGASMQKEIKNYSNFTSPLKLFEYMSHKKPIIASDLPVIREVLNEKNSILVECDNTNLWLRAINYLRKSENREIIANQALLDFSKFTWKKRANRAVKLN